MTADRRKKMNEVMSDYLREEQVVSRREPTEFMLPVITAARHARFAPGGRLAFADDGKASPEALVALNASPWIMVSDVDGFEGFSQLVKSGDGLWLVEIGWREGSSPEAKERP
jgi:hypothetical protein